MFVGLCFLSHSKIWTAFGSDLGSDVCEGCSIVHLYSLFGSIVGLLGLFGRGRAR